MMIVMMMIMEDDDENARPRSLSLPLSRFIFRSFRISMDVSMETLLRKLHFFEETISII